jgi:hypothetical protein
MFEIFYFTDRSYLTQLTEPTGTLVEAMRQKGLIAPDHKRVRFCGFFAWRSGRAVFLPANSDLTQKPFLAAHLLLRTLNQYYSSKKTGIHGTNGDTLIGEELLSLVVIIFEDYQANGLYVRRNRYNTLNQGKINWQRTVSRHIPLPSATAPVYLELESSRTRYISDCETARIHAAVLRDINKQFGVLLFGENNFYDETLETMPLPSESIETQIAHLDRELTLCYSEREIRLIKSLRYYLEKKQGNHEAPLIIGTRQFHHVWETMLDFSLAGEHKFNSKLPVPYYLKDGYFHEVAEKGQRTDTVLRTDDGARFAVVDAKYYTATSLQDAPGWPDLVKQFFYQKAVKAVAGEDAIVSTHFVFPGNTTRLTSAHVGGRGQDQNVTLLHTEGFPVIHCHYCDPVVLMNTYVSYGSLPRLRESILQIP